MTSVQESKLMSDPGYWNEQGKETKHLFTRETAVEGYNRLVHGDLSGQYKNLVGQLRRLSEEINGWRVNSNNEEVSIVCSEMQDQLDFLIKEAENVLFNTPTATQGNNQASPTTSAPECQDSEVLGVWSALSKLSVPKSYRVQVPGK